MYLVRSWFVFTIYKNLHLRYSNSYESQNKGLSSDLEDNQKHLHIPRPPPVKLKSNIAKFSLRLCLQDAASPISSLYWMTRCTS